MVPVLNTVLIVCKMVKEAVDLTSADSNIAQATADSCGAKLTEDVIRNKTGSLSNIIREMKNDVELKDDYFWKRVRIVSNDICLRTAVSLRTKKLTAVHVLLL